MKLLFPTTTTGRRRRDRVLTGLFLVFCLVIVIRATCKKAGKEGVLVRNQQFGASFLDRADDPYFIPARGERIHGPYPPSMVLMAAPLSLLPTTLARLVWSTAQALALLWCYFICRRWTRKYWPQVQDHIPLIYAGALLLVSRFLLRDTMSGGGNLLYLTLALTGIDLADRNQERLAGLPLALGLVLKPNLAPLLLPLAIQRKWKTLGLTILTATILFFLPGIYFGLDKYIGVTKRWTRDVITYATLEDLHTHALIPPGMPKAKKAMNQSLREAVHRLCRPPGDTEAAKVNPVTLTPATTTNISRGLALTLLALTLLTVYRSGGKNFLLTCLTLLPLCLLLSPITWKAHNTVLLPLFFVLLAEIGRHRGRPLWLSWGLVIYFIACNLLSQEFIGKAGKNYLQAISIVTWATLLLLLATLHLLNQKTHSSLTE